MSNEDILTWLIKFGHDWVGLNDVYQTFITDDLKFWDRLQAWHDGAYLTKRHVPDAEPRRIEQYKLTEKALRLLNEQ